MLMDHDRAARLALLYKLIQEEWMSPERLEALSAWLDGQHPSTWPEGSALIIPESGEVRVARYPGELVEALHAVAKQRFEILDLPNYRTPEIRVSGGIRRYRQRLAADRASCPKLMAALTALADDPEMTADMIAAVADVLDEETLEGVKLDDTRTLAVSDKAEAAIVDDIDETRGWSGTPTLISLYELAFPYEDEDDDDEPPRIQPGRVVVIQIDDGQLLFAQTIEELETILNMLHGKRFTVHDLLDLMPFGDKSASASTSQPRYRDGRKRPRQDQPAAPRVRMPPQTDTLVGRMGDPSSWRLLTAEGPRQVLDGMALEAQTADGWIRGAIRGLDARPFLTIPLARAGDVPGMTAARLYFPLDAAVRIPQEQERDHGGSPLVHHPQPLSQHRTPAKGIRSALA